MSAYETDDLDWAFELNASSHYGLKRESERKSYLSSIVMLSRI